MFKAADVTIDRLKIVDHRMLERSHIHSVQNGTRPSLWQINLDRFRAYPRVEGLNLLRRGRGDMMTRECWLEHLFEALLYRRKALGE